MWFKWTVYKFVLNLLVESYILVSCFFFVFYIVSLLCFGYEGLKFGTHRIYQVDFDWLNMLTCHNSSSVPVEFLHYLSVLSSCFYSAF